MINLTRLYCGKATPGDSLRYPEKNGGGSVSDGSPTQSVGLREGWAMGKKPVVVWTMTQRCNLRCVHCYSDSGGGLYLGELTKEEAKEMLKDLVSFRIPMLLLSGGEPLIHPYFLN